ncbi:MAG: hypothetical protein JNL08_19490 [Planctomycetes bacterium]|nr:hypothetical protein [Planctomycetota bacterium]
MHPSPSRPTTARDSEQGIALVMAIFFTLLVVGITVTGSLLLRAHQTKTKVSFVAHGQSVQFAKSGLTEALGWLRKQTAQPVTVIDPQLDTSASPPVIDTIDEDIGIVREFEITNSIWGRYEVWKQWDADPVSTRLPWRQQMQCADISDLRGNLSPGSIWRLRCIGYVYRLVDDTVPFDQAPNQILGREIAEVEARRLALQPPGQAALCTRNGNGLSVGTRGRLLGGSTAAGAYYLNGTGSPSVSGTGSACTGTPGQSAATTYDDSFESVFGVSQTELAGMADYYITNTADFPSTVPVDTLVVCNTGITFTSTQPLRGTGVVAIVGNTTIDVGSYSAFSGLLYVQGNLTMREPSEIQGAVVVTGTVTVLGASDYATVTYDDGILNHLRQELGTYRMSSAVTRRFARDD